MSSFGGIIKRIQTNTITITSGQTTGTAAISAIDTDKAMLLYQGFTTENNNIEDSYCAINIESTVQVKATRAETSNSATVGFMVVEFY